MPTAVAMVGHDQGLDHDQAADLLARRAHRPHQRQLTEPLPDGDGEHVVDDERAHEDRDEGERQQAVLEEAEDLADGIGRLVGQLLAGDDLGPRREHLLQRSLDLGDGMESSTTLMSMASTPSPVSNTAWAVGTSQPTTVAPVKPLDSPSPM